MVHVRTRPPWSGLRSEVAKDSLLCCPQDDAGSPQAQPLAPAWPSRPTCSARQGSPAAPRPPVATASESSRHGSAHPRSQDVRGCRTSGDCNRRYHAVGDVGEDADRAWPRLSHGSAACCSRRRGRRAQSSRPASRFAGRVRRQRSRTPSLSSARQRQGQHQEPTGVADARREHLQALMRESHHLAPSPRLCQHLFHQGVGAVGARGDGTVSGQRLQAFGGAPLPHRSAGLGVHRIDLRGQTRVAGIDR